MTPRFNSPSFEWVLRSLVETLDSIGYRGELVEQGYHYRDFLAPGTPDRLIDAALFGRTPPDYHTALIGIAMPNGESGETLINSHRSLGAPIIIEIGEPEIGIWSVGHRPDQTRKQHSFDLPKFRAWVKAHTSELSPTEFLRTKNIKKGPSFIQGSLFAGLIPELEDRIAETLEELYGDNAGAHAAELVATMRAHGAFCALVTGGFTLYSGYVREFLGFDNDQANRLEIVDGRLTGRVLKPVLDRLAKQACLLRLCQELSITPREAVAVGDGANDLAMVLSAGLGVAYHAQSMLAGAAAMRVDHGDLTALLYAQGYRASEIGANAGS